MPRNKNPHTMNRSMNCLREMGIYEIVSYKTKKKADGCRLADGSREASSYHPPCWIEREQRHYIVRFRYTLPAIW